MATEDNTKDSGCNATVSQLLDLSDRLDNARFGVVACRLATCGALHGGTDEGNALSLMFAELERVMTELCESFDLLVMKPAMGEVVQS